MLERANVRDLLEMARERGRITLEELLRAAASSAPSTEGVVALAREAGLGLVEVEEADEAAAWEDLAKLAAKGEAAFEVSREAPVPAEELAAESPAAIYLREISRTPLLTAEEEVQLAQEREAGLAARQRLAAGVDDPVERARLEEAVARGEAAHRRLFESNLRLVVSVARKYLGRGLAFLDLVQEGNLGLQRAIEKYDWRKGYRFSTYAYWWIRQAITRAIADQGRTIRLPVHIVERITRVLGATHELEAELGRSPTPEEIAERLGIQPEQVRQAQLAARVPISLESPVGESEEAVVADFLADEAARAPIQAAEEAVLADTLTRALDEYLTPREAEVLRLRFGLDGDRERSLGEIGQVLGLSRERVRQIESEAMQKLRAAPALRSRLKEYLE